MMVSHRVFHAQEHRAAVSHIRVTKVIAMAAAGQGGGGIIKTEIGDFTVLRRKDWTTLELGFVRGWSMGLKTSEGEVLGAWPADTDLVRAVGSIADAGERIAVDLMRRQTFLYLERAAPNFARMHLALEEAVRSKRAVVVAVAPGHEVIEDLRFE